MAVVSIVTACRNEAGNIDACLRSMLAQEAVDGGFEVIVADGMSNDGTTEILSRLARVDSRLRVVQNTGRIVSTGLNAAINAACGQVIVRMDAHTEYAPDYLRQCLAVLRQTGADNVGGPARTKAHGYMGCAVAAAYHSFFSVGGARFHDAEYEGPVDTVTYGCWPRSVFDRIGLFDEELVRNQDDEFNLRLTRAGGKIWQSPRIRSWYTPRGSLTALFRQYFQYGYWKVRVIQKHKLPASARHLVPGLFVLGLALGWIAGFVHWSLWLVYGGAVGGYAILSLFFSVRAAMGRRDEEGQRGRAASAVRDQKSEVSGQSDRASGPQSGRAPEEQLARRSAEHKGGRGSETEPQSDKATDGQKGTIGENGGGTKTAESLKLLRSGSLAAARHNWDLLPVLPIVFLTYHLAYGIGFLLGIWDFTVRRRGGRREMGVLTR